MNQKALLLATIGICAVLFLWISKLGFNQKNEIAIYPANCEDVCYFRIDFPNHLTIRRGTKSDSSLSDGDAIKNVKYEERIALEKSELEMINKAFLAMKTSHADNRFTYRDCSIMQVLYQNDFYVYYLAEGACPKEAIELAQFLGTKCDVPFLSTFH